MYVHMMVMMMMLMMIMMMMIMMMMMMIDCSIADLISFTSLLDSMNQFNTHRSIGVILQAYEAPLNIAPAVRKSALYIYIIIAFLSHFIRTHPRTLFHTFSLYIISSQTINPIPPSFLFSLSSSSSSSSGLAVFPNHRHPRHPLPLQLRH